MLLILGYIDAINNSDDGLNKPREINSFFFKKLCHYKFDFKLNITLTDWIFDSGPLLRFIKLYTNYNISKVRFAY